MVDSLLYLITYTIIMLELLYVLYFIISYTTIIYLEHKLYEMYYNSKQKHRDELCEVILFVGKYYIRTNISIRRCYIKLFRFFQRKPLGIIFEGIQVIVKDNKNNILICEKEKSRHNDGKYDLGAGGMVIYTHSPEKTAKEELMEELGLNNNIKYTTTLTPCDGVNCIIHIYITEIDDIEKLNYIDGTYVKSELLNIDDIINGKYDLKEDGKVIMNMIKNKSIVIQDI